MPANSAADPVKSGRPFLYEVAHGSAVWKPHYGRIYDIVAFATLFIYLFIYLRDPYMAWITVAWFIKCYEVEEWMINLQVK
jgi:hypothetical protein